MVLTRLCFLFAPLLWRSGYLHDGGAEEILQCHEEVRIQETAETDTQATGKDWSHLSSILNIATANYLRP